ncbi:MAG: VanW family protein [Clostridia bacterium]|nr:VanW family protein [Clostridia bacterium]
MAGRKKDELKLPNYINGNNQRSKSPSSSPERKPAQPQRKQNSSRTAASKPAPRRNVQEQRRPKKRVNYRRLITVLGIFILIICGTIFLLSRTGRGSEQLVIGTEQVMPDGVKILGIDVGGDTKAKARQAVSAAADEIINSALITINADGEQYTIGPQQINLGYDIESTLQRALAYVPAESGVVDVTSASAPGEINDIFTWNPTNLRMEIEEIAEEFDIKPVEAEIEPLHAPTGISFNFKEGKAGRVLDVEQTYEYISSMLGTGMYTFSMDAVYNNITPSITQADLQGGFGLRASYSTQFPTSRSDETVQNRVFNIEKAADIVSGTVVAPGEEWSFNGHVGPRTYDTGWKGANGIADGKDYTIQAGGGICQVSTTLYNALLCADVEISYRRAHTIPSTYVDKGLDATVDSITNIDLKFKNNTGAPIYLYAFIEDVPDTKYKTITFEIYGKSLPDGVVYKTRSEIKETIRRKDVNYTDDDTIPRGYKLVTLEARNGYVVEAYQDKYVNGVLESSELLYTDTYKGNAEEARRGTASPKYYTPPEGAVPIED